MVVFDAADNAVPARVPVLIGFAVAALAACVIGALIVRREWQQRAHIERGRSLGVVALAVALLIVVAGSTTVVMLTAASTLSPEQTTRAIEASPVVEGPVEHFHPMPSGGHANERFDVAGVHFEYSHWSASQGFNRDITVGGPIREGSYVRIHYVYEAAASYATIVRLEMRR